MCNNNNNNNTNNNNNNKSQLYIGIEFKLVEVKA